MNDKGKTACDVLGGMLALLRLPHMTTAWWLLAIAITGGTNLLDFIAAAQPDAGRTPLFAVAALLRVGLVFWLGYAVIRHFAGEPSPMKITAAFFRFALFMI